VLISSALRKVCQERDIKGYRGVVRWQRSSSTDDAARADLADLHERRPQDARGQDRDPPRTAVQTPVRVTTNAMRARRRNTAMGECRRAANGHGVKAVPPDDAYPNGNQVLKEGCRGRRARVPDQQVGRELMRSTRRCPAFFFFSELASRDVVSRSEQADEIDEWGRRINRLGHARPSQPRRRADPRAAPGSARALEDVPGTVDHASTSRSGQPGAPRTNGAASRTDSDGATE